MTDYTQINDTEIDPDAPIPSLLGYRWRDNPIAMFEGASGAPRLNPRAWQPTYLGAISATAANAAGITDILGIGAIDVRMMAKGGSGTPILQVDLSSNNGATWGGYQNIYSGLVQTGDRLYTLDLSLNIQTGAFRVTGGYIDSAAAPAFLTATTGTITPLANANAIRFRVSSGSGFSAMVHAAGGLV